MLEVGTNAPDFVLKQSNGKDFKLSDHAGKVVVIFFYPQDFTPNCTREVCQFQDIYAEFKKLGIVVIGISPDSVESHAKFEKEHALKYILLSDPEKHVLKAYGSWGLKKLYGREFDGVIRSTFIIGADGKIKRVWKALKVDGHATRVLEEVKKLCSGE